MANGPIGISFLPSQDNQDNGPKQGAMEGDLGQAFKILSLRLPRVVGAHAPTPSANLAAPGAQGAIGRGSGMDPHAALFEALIKAMLQGGGGDSMAPMGGGMSPMGSSQKIDDGTGLSPLGGGSDGGGGGVILRPKIGFVDPGASNAGTFPRSSSSGSWQDHKDLPATTGLFDY